MTGSLPEFPNTVLLGNGYQIDPGVILGYLTGRHIDDTKLEIGPGARIRSGAVIYAGSKIGAELETGHNVVIREKNTIGDCLNIWNSSTIDYGCVLGDGVKIHSNVYLAQFTTIEDEVLLAPAVTIVNDPHPLCGLCMRGPRPSNGERASVQTSLCFPTSPLVRAL